MKDLRADADAAGQQVAGAMLAREMLQSSLKLAALGSLLRAFAHDGNNRLMVIMSCVDMLSLDPLGEQDRREALTLATGASRQLADDLSALLTGAMAQVAHPQRVELAIALETTVALFGFMSERSTPVALGGSSPAWVMVDPTQLRPALLRLLLGAEHLGATAITTTIATFDSAELAVDLPMLRKGHYAGIEFECIGARVPQRFVARSAAQGSMLDLLQETAGLEFVAVEAYARAMRGALLVRPDVSDGSNARIRLLLPLQD